MSNDDMDDDCLRAMFNKYAGAGGNANSMCKNELKTMLITEWPKLLKCATMQQDVDKLMSALDRDHDKEVDFNEFMVLIRALSKIAQNQCHS